MIDHANEILIIENDQTFSTVLSDNLSPQGFTVTTSDSGEDGFKKAMESKPGLIILDLMLGSMTGIEVLQEIRKDTSWGKSVPILVISSVPFLPNMDQVKEMATKFIPKENFDMELLIKQIRILLKHNPSETQK